MPADPASPPNWLDAPAIVAVDRRVDAWAGRLRGSASFDRAMYGLSQAANHSLLWHGINLVDAVLGGAVAGRAHSLRALRRSVVLSCEQALVNGPIKSRFRRGRPTTVTEHPHELRTPVTSSFPSGHSSAGACAAVLLSRDLGLEPLWWTLAAGVAWSRVHVGAHHASDLLGGAAVGTALGTLVGWVWPPPSQLPHRN